jgi:hypothetical protein
MKGINFRMVHNVVCICICVCLFKHSTPVTDAELWFFSHLSCCVVYIQNTLIIDTESGGG